MKILFICTHNRCRSILAEAIANHFGEGIITAASAGSDPAGKVHPRTLEALAARNIPVAGLTSKSWDTLEDFKPDVVITVCDNAAREQCPVWLGDVTRAHWGLADPSAIEGDHDNVMAAFNGTIDMLIDRVAFLSGFLEQNPDKAQLQMRLKSWQ